MSNVIAEHIAPPISIEGTPREVAIGITRKIIQPAAKKLAEHDQKASVNFCIALFGAMSAVLNQSCAGDIKKFENAIASIKQGMDMALELEKAGVTTKSTMH